MRRTTIDTTPGMRDFLELLSKAMFDTDKSGSPVLSDTGHEILKALAGGQTKNHNNKSYKDYTDKLNDAVDEHFRTLNFWIP